MKNELKSDTKMQQLIMESDSSIDIPILFEGSVMKQIYQYEALKYRRRTWFFIMTSFVFAIALMIILPLLFANYASMVFISFLLKLIALSVIVVILFKLNDVLSKKKHVEPAQAID